MFIRIVRPTGYGSPTHEADGYTVYKKEDCPRTIECASIEIELNEKKKREQLPPGSKVYIMNNEMQTVETIMIQCLPNEDDKSGTGNLDAESHITE